MLSHLAGLLVSPGVSTASISFQSECRVLRRGALQAMTRKKHVTSVLTLKHISLEIWRKLQSFRVCVTWPPVCQSLTEHTWHKHKIVEILAKIVVAVVVFDWVLNFTQCQSGQHHDRLMITACVAGSLQLCCMYFTFPSTLFCWWTELQLDVEVLLSRTSLCHSTSVRQTAQICAQCPCSCIFVHLCTCSCSAVTRIHINTGVHSSRSTFCNFLSHNSACSRTAVTQWTVRYMFKKWFPQWGFCLNWGWQSTLPVLENPTDLTQSV